MAPEYAVILYYIYSQKYITEDYYVKIMQKFLMDIIAWLKSRRDWVLWYCLLDLLSLCFMSAFY